jgi:ABC-type nitrate/sulfonate/bicarbonate transport system permease component
MAVMKPLADYVTSQQGSSAGTASYRTEARLNMSQVIAAIATIAAVVSFIYAVVKK